MAEGGGSMPDKLEDAIEAAYEAVGSMTGKN